MQCEECKDKLLSLVDGGDPDECAAVAEHVAGCPECQAELDLLRRGHQCLSQSLEQLAPSGRYLTHARRRRLHKALAASQQAGRMPALRVLVACTAIAAIMVSGFFIYQDVTAFLRPPAVSTRARVEASGQGVADFSPIRVGLASSPQQNRLHVVSGYISLGGGAAAHRSPLGRLSVEDLVLTSSPGVHVPVDNPLYDPEQAGYWW